MRITTAGRYGVRVMLDVAMNNTAGPVLRGEIAARQNISSEYIAQLARGLLQAGLLKSAKGPGGGYQLARPAEAIRVGDIFRAVEGPVAAVACLLPENAGACPRASACAARVLWQRLSRVIETFLDSVWLSDLATLAGQLESQAVPNCLGAVDALFNAVEPPDLDTPGFDCPRQPTSSPS